MAGYVIKRFGVGMATLFLPLAMLISSTWVLVGYGLASILVLKIADGAFRYSINKAGLELLFLPIPQNVKKKTKVFIDTFADRLARGISGFLLLIFYTWMGLSIAQVSLISIALVMIWISIVLAMRKEYVNSFRKALEKREINLEDLRLNISEASTLPLLTEALKSENERQVVYALDMLSGVEDRALLPALRPLIRHSSAEVRRKALALLGNIGDGELIPEVQKRLADPDVAVRTEAIRFICAHGAAEQPEQLQQYLQDPDPLTRAAAAGYIAAHGSPSEKELIDRRLIEELLRVSDAGAETVRAHLCSVLGTLQKPEYYPYLFQMLEDPSPVVKRAAIAGAGQTRHREFIPPLLQLLGKPPFRAHARAALANFGERILGTLNDHLLDESVDFSIRRSIPRLISEIPVQRSVNVLLEALPQVPSPLKHEVLRALNRMRKRYPDLRFHPEVVLDALRAEVQEYYVARCALIHFSPDDGTSPSEAASGEPLRLFRRALQEKLDRSMERVFRLLGLLYPLRDIYSAYLGIISNDKPLRASGIEFLDNLLSRQLKTYVMPLLEQQSSEELKRRGRRLFQLDLDDPEKALSYLIQNNDPWLKACAIYVAPIIGRDRFNSLIESARKDSNPFVQEAAARALKLQE
ncbi:MAG: hypothetical protein D6681_00625 [Calditrichaeota bacterium]|nr:MAG: hypothetical protein D6681_00625 [Calditrichota bacterium]